MSFHRHSSRHMTCFGENQHIICRNLLQHIFPFLISHCQFFLISYRINTDSFYGSSLYVSDHPTHCYLFTFSNLTLILFLLAIAINQAGKEWKKYSVTVDIPVNVLVKFVFKLCAGANNQLTGYNATPTENVVYWFDDVSLKLATE